VKTDAKQADLGYQNCMNLSRAQARHMKTGPAIAAILLAALTIAATGCGRRGDLEAPSVARAEARGEERPAEPAAPDRRFILDALIE
jgi:predicted small lipoprotein YifL